MLTAEGVGVRMSGHWPRTRVRTPDRRWRALGRHAQADGRGRRGRDIGPAGRGHTGSWVSAPGLQGAQAPSHSAVLSHSSALLWPVLPRMLSKILTVMLNRCSSVKCSKRNVYPHPSPCSLALQGEEPLSLGQSRDWPQHSSSARLEDLSLLGWPAGGRRAWWGCCPRASMPPPPPRHRPVRLREPVETVVLPRSW